MARYLRGRAPHEPDSGFNCILSRLPSADGPRGGAKHAPKRHAPLPPSRLKPTAAPRRVPRPQQAKDTGPERRLFKELCDGTLSNRMPQLRRPPRTARETALSLTLRPPKPPRVPPQLPCLSPRGSDDASGLQGSVGKEAGAHVQYLLHRADVALDLGAESVALSEDKIQRAREPRKPYIRAEFQRLHNPVPLASFWSNKAQILGALENPGNNALELEAELLQEDGQQEELCPQELLLARRQESFFHLMEHVESARAEAFRSLTPKTTHIAMEPVVPMSRAKF